jgi:hypothetical protein
MRCLMKIQQFGTDEYRRFGGKLAQLRFYRSSHSMRNTCGVNPKGARSRRNCTLRFICTLRKKSAKTKTKPCGRCSDFRRFYLRYGCKTAKPQITQRSVNLDQGWVNFLSQIYPKFIPNLKKLGFWIKRPNAASADPSPERISGINQIIPVGQKRRKAGRSWENRSRPSTNRRPTNHRPKVIQK